DSGPAGRSAADPGGVQDSRLVRSEPGAGLQHEYLPFRRAGLGGPRHGLDLLHRREEGRRRYRHPVRAADQRSRLASRHAVRAGAPQRPRIPVPADQEQRRPRREAASPGRHRPGQGDAGLKPLEEARAEVLGSVGPLGTEEVDLAEAGGRILAEPVIASHDLPPFPNSAMDGYAVLADDLAQVPVRLQVVEDVPAGSVATRPVTRGTAIKIMTGAPLPEGADTVVKVEVTHQPDAGTVV